MAPHSNTLAWNPMDGGAWWAAVHGVEEESDTTERLHFHFSLSLFTFTHWRSKWQPTPVFLPGESQGRGSLGGCHLRGRTESDTTEVAQQQQQQFDPRGGSRGPDLASEAGWNFGNKGCDLMSPTPGRAHDEHVHARVYLSPRGTGPVREGASSAQHKRNGVSARRTVRPGGAPQKGRISRRSIWRATV